LEKVLCKHDLKITVQDIGKRAQRSGAALHHRAAIDGERRAESRAERWRAESRAAQRALELPVGRAK
jgi:hypothetical protein